MSRPPHFTTAPLRPMNARVARQIVADPVFYMNRLPASVYEFLRVEAWKVLPRKPKAATIPPAPEASPGDAA